MSVSVCLYVCVCVSVYVCNVCFHSYAHLTVIVLGDCFVDSMLILDADRVWHASLEVSGMQGCIALDRQRYFLESQALRTGATAQNSFHPSCKTQRQRKLSAGWHHLKP